MRSLRLDADLEGRLTKAAAIRGESVSEFIRRAVVDRADATLRVGDVEYFEDVLGVVHGGGGRARRTGDAFADLVSEQASRK